MSLTPAQLRTKETFRAVRQETAEATGEPEGRVAVWGLPPTLEGFFGDIKPFVTAEGKCIEIDQIRLKRERPDSDESLGNTATALLLELEVRDLIEDRGEGRLYVSEIGRQALSYLFE